MRNYTSVEFMTAEEKQKVFKDWKKFLEFLTSGEYLDWNKKQSGSDYGLEAPKQFTKRLYSHLSLHCGFIAHYNIHGFYSEYFNGEMRSLQMFFNNFKKSDCGGYNSQSAWGDYQDLGEDMADEYLNCKNVLMKQGEIEEIERFTIIRDQVKRAETDRDLRRRIVERFF